MRLQPLAISLRKNQTETEKVLWSKLRSNQLNGNKFRRQQPIGNYIVDFVCFEKQVIIELDGGHHTKQVEKDRLRDKWLKEQGYKVLRFWNGDIFKNIEGVLGIIKQELK